MYEARQRLPMHGIDANPSEILEKNEYNQRNRYLYIVFYINKYCFHRLVIDK
jgi:hypothetical protein